MKCVALLASASLAMAAVVRRARPFRRDLPIASSTDFDEMHRAALLSSAAYSDCQGTAFGMTIDQVINDPSTGTNVRSLDSRTPYLTPNTHPQGFIGHDDLLQRISVVMRGTTSPRDALSDVDIASVTAPTLSGVNFPTDAQLMRGVVTAWSSVHDSVMQNVSSLAQQYPNYTIEAMGHSLGGSLTYLAHVALAQNFPNSTVVSNALAAFPIGNQPFTDWASSQGKLRRGDNQGDGVPNMWAKLFEHYGTEFYGPGVANLTYVCNGERDSNCSAGDGWFTVNLQHTSNSGVQLALVGCG
jgi:Lipase (class 3)